MKKVQTGLRLREDLNEKVTEEAKRKDISKNALMNQIIFQYYNGKTSSEKK